MTLRLVKVPVSLRLLFAGSLLGLLCLRDPMRQTCIQNAFFHKNATERRFVSTFTKERTTLVFELDLIPSSCALLPHTSYKHSGFSRPGIKESQINKWSTLFSTLWKRQIWVIFSCLVRKKQERSQLDPSINRSTTVSCIKKKQKPEPNCIALSKS